MSARFEVVRGDAGWHARFRAGNGRIVWVTETYTRERAALAAIRVMAAVFAAFTAPQLVDRNRAVQVALDFDPLGQKLALPIRHVDERTGAGR